MAKRKRPKHEVPPPEFLKLLEDARRSADQSAPRKHHLVPASYLRRWAEGGRIRVTQIEEKNSYLAAPEKAARETDYYRIEAPEISPDEVPPLLFETMLGRVED